MFGFPAAFDFWNLYFSKFIARYKGSKMERLRDLFEQALVNCPAKQAKTLYFKYAQCEEEFGLARHALRILGEAARKVAVEDLFEVYSVHIAKAAAFFGLAATRGIYEEALRHLPDVDGRATALHFAHMEIQLGEIDRARAVLAYAAQWTPPASHDDFWRTWHAFEVTHGNEDTFKEMLRVKRSVQARFAHSVDARVSQTANAASEVTRGDEASLAKPSAPSPAKLLDNNTRVAGFVRAEITENTETAPDSFPDSFPQKVQNPSRIDMDDETDDEAENKAASLLGAHVPDAIFGNLLSETHAQLKRKR